MVSSSSNTASSLCTALVAAALVLLSSCGQKVVKPEAEKRAEVRSEGVQLTQINGTPVVTFTGVWTEKNKSILAGDSSVVVTWNASDREGDAILYTLEFSDDDGETWQMATCLSYTDAGCTWNASGDGLDAGTDFLLRITAEDGNSASSETTQNKISVK